MRITHLQLDWYLRSARLITDFKGCIINTENVNVTVVHLADYVIFQYSHARQKSIKVTV